jgi:hypothetical protein
MIVGGLFAKTKQNRHQLIKTGGCDENLTKALEVLPPVIVYL